MEVKTCFFKWKASEPYCYIIWGCVVFIIIILLIIICGLNACKRRTNRKLTLALLTVKYNQLEQVEIIHKLDKKTEENVSTVNETTEVSTLQQENYSDLSKIEPPSRAPVLFIMPVVPDTYKSSPTPFSSGNITTFSKEVEPQTSQHKVLEKSVPEKTDTSKDVDDLYCKIEAIQKSKTNAKQPGENGKQSDNFIEEYATIQPKKSPIKRTANLQRSISQNRLRSKQQNYENLYKVRPISTEAFKEADGIYNHLLSSELPPSQALPPPPLLPMQNNDQETRNEDT